MLYQVDEFLLLMHIELAIDAFGVGAGRSFGYLQVAGYDRDRPPFREKHQYLAFARRQPEALRGGGAAFFKTRRGGGVALPE